MSESSPRSQIILEFDPRIKEKNLAAITDNLSAVTFTDQGKVMWLGSDELIDDTPSIDRLELISEGVYGNHQRCDLTGFLNIAKTDDEIDIEGLDYSDRYLWLTGSHSSTRKKTTPENIKESLKRLGKIKPNLNRCMIARIPIIDGKLHKSAPKNSKKPLSVACLQKTKDGNELLEELRQDRHLAPYLNAQVALMDDDGNIETTRLPSKENGLDIEGLAVVGDRLFLGLRGPVLRGEWAIILEIELEEKTPGILSLKKIGKKIDVSGQKYKRKYKKHFVALRGLGVRDLCYDQDKKDLLILAGATMNIKGGMQLFRLKDVLELKDDSILTKSDKRLEHITNLNSEFGTENAEGIAIFPAHDRHKSLLVVYDAPSACRKLGKDKVWADIFTL